jgi:hypothetical protein
MKLKHLLLERKSDILGRWFSLIMETYPAETSGFLENKKSQFTNPVGHIISKGIEELFEGLLESDSYQPDKIDSEKFTPILDSIVRIRAVQDFTPSQSIAFIILLKKIIREELKNYPDISRQENLVVEELSALESKIDNLTLLSFDIFMKCRERIYELKANEVKNMTFRLLQRANLIHDTEKQELTNLR